MVPSDSRSGRAFGPARSCLDRGRGSSAATSTAATDMAAAAHKRFSRQRGYGGGAPTEAKRCL